MATSTKSDAISRRNALAGLSAGGLGAALAASASSAAAEKATPTIMTGHPMVGTWIVDPEPENTANMPSILIYTSDGIVIDPVAGFGGSWEATGARTGVFTLSGIFEDGTYLVIRGPVEVDEATDTTTGPYTVTVVGADGTVLNTMKGTGHTTRLPARSGEPGTPLAGFPTWIPATPAGGTPTS
jgi:hypothetical protein